MEWKGGGDRMPFKFIDKKLTHSIQIEGITFQVFAMDWITILKLHELFAGLLNKKEECGAAINALYAKHIVSIDGLVLTNDFPDVIPTLSFSLIQGLYKAFADLTSKPEPKEASEV